MRIAILAVILALLLTPSLRSGAAAPSATTLHPTAAYPGASGTAQVELLGGRTTVTIALHGLPRAVAGRAVPVYVAWLATSDRRLYNLGAFTANDTGDAMSTFTPFAAPQGEFVIVVSAEPRADVSAPTAPRDTILLSAQLGAPPPPAARGLDAELGPGWFTPIIPAALGLFLLRHAARAHRAELRARRVPLPLAAPPA